MGNMLLEQDERQSLGGGDARAAPYAIEISNDLKEFVAAQEIPNFGVQVFYAMSIDDPIHRWAFFDERRFPKFIREKIEQLKLMKSAGNINLLKSKQSLLTDQSQSLKDIDEITNLNKCTSKVRSPFEIQKSQERIYQAYINYESTRPPADFNEKCNGSEKSWRKVRTTKKVCPDGTEVSITKIDESGPAVESDADCRSNVRVTHSETVREVEVKGDDENAVEAAAKKEMENLMKEHSPPNAKGSGSCECHGHKKPTPSRRCSSGRNQSKMDGSHSERRNCPDLSTARTISSAGGRPRNAHRSPCNESPRNFDEDIDVPPPSPNGFRGRSPCGHVKKHSPGCGGMRCPCCMCSKGSHSCGCKSGGASAALPVSQGNGSPCHASGSNGHYRQNGNGSTYRRGSDNQSPCYERNEDFSMDLRAEERERERRARLRKIAELERKNQRTRCSPKVQPEVRGRGRSACPCHCPREATEDESSPCIGSAVNTSSRRTPPRHEMSESVRRPKSPCSTSRTLTSPDYRETAVKSLCSEPPKYKCPDRGRIPPVVNKTRIIEKSETIYRNEDEPPRPLAGHSKNISGPRERPRESPPESPCPEDSIPITDRYSEYYSTAPRTPGRRYTSTPKKQYSRTPDFGEDLSEIHDRQELTMLSPEEPSGFNTMDEGCVVSSNESDFDLQDFPEDFSISQDCPPSPPCGPSNGNGGLPERYFRENPTTPPTPGQIMEKEGILEFLADKIDEDAIRVPKDRFVSPLPFSEDDDTFSSPEQNNYQSPAHDRSGPTHSRPCPPDRPSPPSRPTNFRQPERKTYTSPCRKSPCSPQKHRPMYSETSRPRYETPQDRPRRPPHNYPQSLPRSRQWNDYSPVGAYYDSQSSDSDHSNYKSPCRNLLSTLRTQTSDRNQPSRNIESSRGYERRREERPCGCDDDTSDELYNNRRPHPF